MKKSLMLLVAAIALLSLGQVSADAQTTLTAAGNPMNSAMFPVEHGFINLGNGNLHLEIPIAAPPQRGKLSLPATFVYDSAIWQVVGQQYGLEWAPTAGGWSFQYDHAYGANATIDTPNPCSNPTPIYVFSAIQWTDAHQTLHTFPLKTVETNGCSNPAYPDTPTSSGYATDGSGYYASLTGYSNLQVWDPQGTLQATTPVPSYGVGNEAIVDRNGNKIQYAASGALQGDSLNHPVLQQTVAQTDAYGYPSVLYIDVPVAQSHTARYVVTYEWVTTSTNFDTPGCAFGKVLGSDGKTYFCIANGHADYDQGTVDEPPASIRVLQSLALPDGSSYSFGYDSYGQLNSVTLPHGGTIGYTYTNDSGAGVTTPPRWASQHVGSSGTTNFAYTYNGTYSPTSETGGYSCSKITNAVTDSALAQTYVFSSCNGAIQPMKMVLAPAANPSSPDKFVLYGYDFSNACQNGACTGAQWITLTGIMSVLPTSGSSSSILAGGTGSGLIADTQVSYAAPGSGQIASVKQWDYRSATYPGSMPDSPPGNPKREADAAFGYTAGHALLPTDITTKDSTGAVITEVQYTYDEPAYFTSSPAGIPNHDNTLAASPRGNPTTIKRIPHGGSTAPTLTQHVTYDDAGAVVAMTDPKGNITTFGYDATDTFPETVTRPVTTGLGSQPVQHVTTTVHDFNTGQVLSVTDENGQVTSRTYDSIGRLSTTQFSNGGTPVTLSTTTYPSANETDTTVLQVQDAYETASISSSSIVDGYGRPSQSVREGITSETTYNSLGHVETVTNAHASNASSTDGTTHFYYDELGRPSSTTLPNGKTVSYSYSLNTSTITDPLAHSRQQTFDAFGNLISVLEPDDSGALTWQSVYTRTDWGLLQQIDQKGGSSDPTQWRSRYFTFDGLGRVHTQTTPEAGQTTYNYDDNGNIQSVVNANATGNTVSFTYDVLNRVLSKQVDGGPAYSYTYDAQDASGDLYGRGRLTSVTDNGNNSSFFTHDPLGNVVTSQECRTAGCTSSYQMSATYDFLGNLRALTYPDQRRIEWVYDSFNRPTDEIYTFFGSTEMDVPFMVGATYFPTGQLQSVTDGNGTTVTASADPMGDVTALNYNNGSDLLNRQYTWADNGANLLSATDSATGRTQTYTYDQLDRLKTATDTGTTGAATNPSLPSVPSSSETYTYTAWGNLQQSGNLSFTDSIGADNRVSCTGCYDNAGNMLQDGFFSHTYRADGRQTSSGSTSYAYDALDQRVAKTTSGATTQYFYFGGTLIATLDASGNFNDVLYGAHGLLGSVPGVATADPAYRVGDQLDTLSVTSDINGSPTGGATTLPFGQIMSNTSSDPFLFTGDEWDSENQSYNTTFRQYSPRQGRWLTPDPYAGSYNLADPQSFNRYTYALNQPTGLVDPAGLDGCKPGDYCLVWNAGGSSSGGGGGYADAGGPISDGGGDGVSWNIIGGGGSITTIGWGSAPMMGWQERQNYTYQGPGATAQHDSSSLLDWTQNGLRMLGVIPEAGALFNFINVGIDLYRGNYGAAAMDGIATAASFVGAGGIAEAAELAEGAAAAEQGVGVAVETAEEVGAAEGETALAPYYPANDGFLGETSTTYLRPGEMIDRYGGSNGSRFFSPVGTSAAERALPASTLNQPLRTFEVLKPLPVESGYAAPAFGQPGMGMQFRSPVPLGTLLGRGILREVLP